MSSASQREFSPENATTGVHARPVVAQFQFAHDNISQLLRVLEGELERMRTDDSPDYELSLSVLHYVTRFTDRYHHPSEDLALRVLAERHPLLAQSVTGLESEHAKLLTSGEQLMRLLADVISDGTVARDSLCAHVADYVQGLRAHMEREELALFPLLSTHLSAQDFARIEETVGRAEDPLFGGVVHDRYAALQRELALLG